MDGAIVGRAKPSSARWPMNALEREGALGVAEHLISKGRFAEASEELGKILRADPADLAALVLIGTAMKWGGDQAGVGAVLIMLPPHSRERDVRLFRIVTAFESQPFEATVPLLRDTFLEDIDAEYIVVAFAKYVLRHDEELSAQLGRTLRLPVLPVPFPVLITETLPPTYAASTCGRRVFITRPSSPTPTTATPRASKQKIARGSPTSPNSLPKSNC